MIGSPLERGTDSWSGRMDSGVAITILGQNRSYWMAIVDHVLTISNHQKAIKVTNSDCDT